MTIPPAAVDRVDRVAQFLLDGRVAREALEVFDDQQLAGREDAARNRSTRSSARRRRRFAAEIGGGEVFGMLLAVSEPSLARWRTIPRASCDLPLPLGPTSTSGLNAVAASTRSPTRAADRSRGGDAIFRADDERTATSLTARARSGVADAEVRQDCKTSGRAGGFRSRGRPRRLRPQNFAARVGAKIG